MNTASARLRVSRSIATVAVLLASFIAICPALNAQLAMGNSAAVHVPPPVKKAPTPVRAQPQHTESLADTINKMTPHQRKLLAKAVKHMTPDERRRLGELLNRQSATSGASPNRVKAAR